MIQTVAAVLLALHGIIHLIGFVTPWRIATLQGFTYRTTALNGALELGDSGSLPEMLPAVGHARLR